MVNMPADPVTELARLSITLHEVYLGHVRAGFAPDQAMQLILAWYTHMLNNLPQANE